MRSMRRVGGGEDFEAEAFFFNDFAGQGDMAGDFRDEAAYGGRFEVLGEAQGGGFVGVGGFVVLVVLDGVKLVGEEVLQA